MPEREGHPAAPDGGSGGMTEATGDLTPDDARDAFIPAERREISDPRASRGVTASAHGRREGRRGREPDDPGNLIARNERVPPNDRDGGYGSQHGLSGDDPAYLEQTELPAAGTGSPNPRQGTRDGVDERSDPREDRF